MFIQRKKSNEELAHVIMEAEKSKSCRAGQQPKDSGRSHVAVCESEGRLLAELPLAQRTSVFILFQPSTN